MPTLAKTNKTVLKKVPVKQIRARDVHFIGNLLCIALRDGREIRIPVDKVEWLQWLVNATPEQRVQWSLEPGGFAVYWEELDDGIELRHLFELPMVQVENA